MVKGAKITAFNRRPAASALSRRQRTGRTRDAGAGVAPRDGENPLLQRAKFRRKATKPNTLQIALQTRIKVLPLRRRYRKSICSIPGNKITLSVRAMAIR